MDGFQMNAMFTAIVGCITDMTVTISTAEYPSVVQCLFDGSTV